MEIVWKETKSAKKGTAKERLAQMNRQEKADYILEQLVKRAGIRIEDMERTNYVMQRLLIEVGRTGF